MRTAAVGRPRTSRLSNDVAATSPPQIRPQECPHTENGDEMNSLAHRALERSELTADVGVAILHYMVKYEERQLDRTFAALVDRTRRAILARLERDDSASVSDLAKPFAIKLPAVMKHLDVLADAGLITRSKVGRTVTVRLRPEPMRQAVSWLQRYERFWSKNLDRLTAYAETKEAEARKKER
jgi:DNA-binding transcriptional ArsR family regulator